MFPFEYELNELIEKEQFTLSQKEKEKILLKIFKEQLDSAYTHNKHIKSWFDKLNLKIKNIKAVAEIPLLPIQMFKKFDLKTCEDEAHIVLESSGTTTQIPSKVPINRLTAARQSKALSSILKNHLSNKRKALLVIDTEDVNKPGTNLKARGAAIRGLSIFAKDICYALDNKEGTLILNKEKIFNFLKKHEEDGLLVFGFTFILWQKLIEENKEDLPRFKFKDIKIVHSGGWKKLTNKNITKEEFSDKISKIFNTDKKNVVDFYGMVEQTGLIFMDCEEGNKHAPNFADIIIRDYYTLEENGFGKEGYIEILNSLPDSYPGMSVLTEDTGILIGIDGCACGRKGKYFQFKKRVEKAEARGCGDTFREGEKCLN